MPPDPMDHHEKMRLRTAAFQATRRYPGPVGELLSKEIMSWEEMGYRFGGGSLIRRLVDDILKPVPTTASETQVATNYA